MKNTHYIGFVLLLFFSIFLAIMTSDYIYQLYDKQARETYTHSPIILLRDILFIPVGIILGLPAFYAKKKQSGKWKFHFLHFLILAIPSLLLMLYLTFYFFTPLPFNILSSSVSLAIFNGSSFPVFAILLGYAIIGNWNKVN